VDRVFADKTIRGQDSLRTCQFSDKMFRGRFAERRFVDKLDYSRTNCLKSPVASLPAEIIKSYQQTAPR